MIGWCHSEKVGPVSTLGICRGIDKIARILFMPERNLDAADRVEVQRQ